MNLAQWWDHVKTDSVPLKIAYFLRNQSAIRSDCTVLIGDGSRWTTLAELLEFIGSKAVVKCHREYEFPPCGVYSIRELEGQRFEFTMRIDPTTPSARGILRGQPSICVCSAVAETGGKFVSIAI